MTVSAKAKAFLLELNELYAKHDIHLEIDDEAGCAVLMDGADEFTFVDDSCVLVQRFNDLNIDDCTAGGAAIRRLEWSEAAAKKLREVWRERHGRFLFSSGTAAEKRARGADEVRRALVALCKLRGVTLKSETRRRRVAAEAEVARLLATVEKIRRGEILVP